MSDDWRAMDRASLSAAYNNSDFTPGFGAIIAEYAERTAAFEAAHAGSRDQAYGPAPRQRFDVFAPKAPAPGAPAFVFIHGGYWQSREKDDFAFVAEGPLGLGLTTVLAEYTLAPEAPMTRIVGEIGALLDHLAGAGHGRIILCGHSAGGHLAAAHRNHPAVVGVLAVSGLFDLAPIQAGALNEALQLSDAEVERFSPIGHIRPGPPTLVAVGAAERPELVRQSRDYAAALAEAGEPARLLELAGLNHFDILFDLARPDGAMLSAMMALSGAV